MTPDQYRALHGLDPIAEPVKKKKKRSAKTWGTGPDGKPFLFDSRFEKEWADKLIVRKLAGEIDEWYTQVVWPLLEKGEVPGERGVIYTSDFVVVIKWPGNFKPKSPIFTSTYKPFLKLKDHGGEIEVHETKAEWLLKTRVDWPIRRKWFKKKYGLKLVEIILCKGGEVKIR